MSHNQQCASKIKVRDWRGIYDEWVASFPPAGESWPAPSAELDELPLLTAYYPSVGKKHSEEMRENDARSFRSASLSDSMAKLRQSIYGLESSLKLAKVGYPTYAQLLAYQAALLSGKTILGLLGISVVRDKSKNKYYQIDAFVEKDAKGALDSGFCVELRYRKNPQHAGIWTLIHRVLCATTIDARLWPYPPMDAVKKLNSDAFNLQRREIAYGVSEWPYPDLESCVSWNHETSLFSEIQNGDKVLPSECDFSIRLGSILVKYACSLAFDLAQDSRSLGAYLAKAINGRGNKGFDWLCISPTVPRIVIQEVK